MNMSIKKCDSQDTQCFIRNFRGVMKVNKYMSLTQTTRITVGRDLKGLIFSFGSGREVN